jgi:hypothetical protein
MMTNHVVRLYALAAAVLVLFVSWAAIAARPWASHSSAKADPRWAALAAREKQLRHEAVLVQRVVAKRWRVYRIRLAARQRQIAAVTRRHREQVAAARAAVAVAPAPSVRVVNLPPVTVTRTS